MSEQDVAASEEIAEPNEEAIADDLDAMVTAAMSQDEAAPEAEVSEPATEAPEETATATDAQEPTDAEPVENEQDAIPQHWPARYRDALANAPAEVKAAWQDHAKTLIGEATRAKQANAEYERTFTPEWKEYIRAQGHPNEASFTQELLSLYATASNDPAQFVQMQANKSGLTPQQYLGKIAQAVGVDLSGVSQQQSGADTYVDPEIEQIRQQHQAELQQVKGQLAGFGDYIQSQRQASIDGVISKFATAKDESGALKHQHFGTVQGEVASLLMSDPGLAELKSRDMGGALAKAYEMAIWSNPETRGQMLAMEQEKAKAAIEAERAKRARSSFSDTVQSKPGQGPTSLDDMISNAMGG